MEQRFCLSKEIKPKSNCNEVFPFLPIFSGYKIYDAIEPSDTLSHIIDLMIRFIERVHPKSIQFLS